MRPVLRGFLGLAALPLVALAILAVFGARGDVGVVTTGTDAHAWLGAAWVAAWLGSVIVSPIAVGAALVSLCGRACRWMRPGRSPSRRTRRPCARARRG